MQTLTRLITAPSGFQPECAYISWQNVYMNEPFANLSLTAAEKALVLGGEAALWAGYTDHTNFDQQVAHA